MRDTPGATQQSATERHAISADLIAVLVAAPNGNPVVLTIKEAAALPSGPFELGHRSLQSGLRNWVEQQTGHPLGYIEQLYTFADRDRGSDGPAGRVISISYLGLTRVEPTHGTPPGSWRGWYEFFPWEDHRTGAPNIIQELIVPRLRQWADTAEQQDKRQNRLRRAGSAFGFDGRPWNEELVLQRYELLFEAGLVEEAARAKDIGDAPAMPGKPMVGDHRRILATGIARLRTKIKYRPVVFELMPPSFTLLQLQRAVEALAGLLVHKQNFRRLIEQQDLVEETGEMSSDTGGRPAKLFRFRHAVLDEHAVAGTK
ncbi:hypothetical protein QEZ47_07290 [Aminobacter anthyllidis]|uniref:NUDIX hydrolase n=1 Tax=Aminobacter anthyllidis TaxID=1035067 RepID=UPI002458CE6C|nr:hypothetical protein [Aminobacter anthyllidis]MDH4985347.1 hypothetical protein [Aminobacter anthyllidis]